MQPKTLFCAAEVGLLKQRAGEFITIMKHCKLAFASPLGLVNISANL